MKLLITVLSVLSFVAPVFADHHETPAAAPTEEHAKTAKAEKKEKKAKKGAKKEEHQAEHGAEAPAPAPTAH